MSNQAESILFSSRIYTEAGLASRNEAEVHTDISGAGAIFTVSSLSTDVSNVATIRLRDGRDADDFENDNGEGWNVTYKKESGDAPKLVFSGSTSEPQGEKSILAMLRDTMKVGFGTDAPEKEIDIVSDGSFAELRLTNNQADAVELAISSGGAYLDVSNGTLFLNARDISNDVVAGRDMTVNQDLFVKRHADVDGNLDVSGNTHLDGTLDVSGDAVFESNVDIQMTLDVSGNTHLDGTLDVSGDAVFESNVDIQMTLDVSGDTHLDGKLDVSGDAVFESNVDIQETLDVSGDTHLDGKLDVSGDAVFESNVDIQKTLDVSGNTHLDGTLDVSGDAVFESNVDIQKTLDVSGNTHLDGTLDVSGDAVFESNVDIQKTLDVSGNTHLDGTLDVSGDAVFESNVDIQKTLDVSGNTHLDGTLDVSGDAVFESNVDIKKTLDVSGNTHLDGTLDVSGDAVFESNVDIKKTLDVSGNTHLDGTLDVSGDAVFESNVDIQETLDVSGDTHLDGTLDVSGDAVFESNVDIQETLDVSGNTHLDGTLDVSGDAVFESNVDIQKTLDVSGTLTVESTSLFKDDVVIDGDLLVGVNVTGDISLGGDLDASGDITANGNMSTTNITASGTAVVSGTTTLGSTLDVTGVTTLGSTLDVTGATTLKNTLTVNENTTLDKQLTVGGTAVVSGATTLEDKLDVTGAATLNSTLDVSGDAVFESNADIHKALDVSGATTLKNTLTVDGVATFNSVVDMTHKKITNVADATENKDAVNLQQTKALITDAFTVGIKSNEYLSESIDTAVKDAISTDASVGLIIAEVIQDTAIESRIDKKYDISGGTITGDVDISGNLDVSGGLTVVGDITAPTFLGNVTGVDISGTNITGTIQTASQPHIKEVGSQIYIDGSDKVGIGTSNPDEKLEVSGGGYFNDRRLRFTNSSNINYIQSGVNPSDISSTSNNWKPLYIGPIGSDSNIKIAIDGSGKVGIGTTTPADKLHVSGNVRANIFKGELEGNVTGDVTGEIQTPSQTKITQVGSLTGLTVGGSVNVTENVDVTGDLTVNDVSASVIRATTFVGDISGNITGDVTGDVSGTILTASQPNITSIGSALDISSGKVGIGTNTPTEKLDVAGNVKATIFKGDLQGNADTATTADKVENAVTFKTTGDVDVTFDGSTAPTIDIVDIARKALDASSNASALTYDKNTGVFALGSNVVLSGTSSGDGISGSSITAGTVTATTEAAIGKSGVTPGSGYVLDVSGNTQISGDISVNGIATFTNDATFSGDLNVTGDVQVDISGDMLVTGDVSAHTIDIQTFKIDGTDYTVDITGLSNNLTTLDTSVNTLEGRATTLEGRATTLEDRATTLDSSVNKLDSSVNTLESRADTLDSSVTVLNTGKLDISGGTITGNLTVDNTVYASTFEGSNITIAGVDYEDDLPKLKKIEGLQTFTTTFIGTSTDTISKTRYQIQNNRSNHNPFSLDVDIVRTRGNSSARQLFKGTYSHSFYETDASYVNVQTILLPKIWNVQDVAGEYDEEYKNVKVVLQNDDTESNKAYIDIYYLYDAIYNISTQITFNTDLDVSFVSSTNNDNTFNPTDFYPLPRENKLVVGSDKLLGNTTDTAISSVDDLEEGYYALKHDNSYIDVDSTTFLTNTNNKTIFYFKRNGSEWNIFNFNRDRAMFDSNPNQHTFLLTKNHGDRSSEGYPELGEHSKEKWTISYKDSSNFHITRGSNHFRFEDISGGDTTSKSIKMYPYISNFDGGRVGINVANPKTLLHVGGNVQIDDSLDMAGNRITNVANAIDNLDAVNLEQAKALITDAFTVGIKSNEYLSESIDTAVKDAISTDASVGLIIAEVIQDTAIESRIDRKFDMSGGDITGDVGISGDLDVSGGLTVVGNITGNLIGNVTGDVTGNLIGNVTGDVTGAVSGDVTGQILTASQPKITSIGVSSALNIDSSGNVGIGTTDPTEKLDVAGNSLFNTGKLRLVNDGTHNYIQSTDASGGTGSWSSLVFGPWRQATNDGTGNIPKLIIDDNGKVGIGKLAPDEKLDVAGNVKASNFIGNLEGTIQTADQPNITSIKHISTVTDETDIEHVIISKNLGIGTTSVPETKLDVAGGLHSNYGRIRFKGKGISLDPYKYINFIQSGKDTTGTALNSWTSLAIGHTGCESSSLNNELIKLIIDDSGNVGIGKLAPDEKLDVVGNVQATKFIGPLEGNVTGTVGTLTSLTVNENVGIGTTSPAAKLHIKVDDIKDSDISYAMTNYNDMFSSITNLNETATLKLEQNQQQLLIGAFRHIGKIEGTYIQPYHVGSTTFERPLYIIPSGGRVGIGTTDISSNAILHVGSERKQIFIDTIKWSGNELDTGIYLRNTNEDPLLGLVCGSDTCGNFYSTIKHESERYINFGDAYKGNTGADSGFTPSGFINIRKTGNVGIGTTTPTEKLDVSGNARLTGNLIIENPNDLEGVSVGDSGGRDEYFNDTQGVLFRGDANINNTTKNIVDMAKIRMHYNFHSSDNATAGREEPTRFPMLSLSTKIFGNGGDGIPNETDSNYNNAYTTNDFDDTLNITQGKVGIGTLHPDETLHVDGTVKATSFDGEILTASQPNITSIGDSALNIDDSSGKVAIGNTTYDATLGVKGSLRVANDDNIGLNDAIQLSVTSKKSFIESKNELFRIHNTTSSNGFIDISENGYVGIGESNPTEKLDVAGNVKATKFIGDIEGDVTAVDASAATFHATTSAVIGRDGAITSGYALDVDGSLRVTGDASFNGTTLLNNATIAGVLTLGDDFAIGGDFNIQTAGDISLGGDLRLHSGGDLILNGGKLYVGGLDYTTRLDNLTDDVSGDLATINVTLSNKLDTSGGTISGNLNVTGDVSLNTIGFKNGVDGSKHANYIVFGDSGDNNGVLRFVDKNNTTHMVIGDGGNIGIGHGTEYAQAKLDVNGNIKAAGDITIVTNDAGTGNISTTYGNITTVDGNISTTTGNISAATLNVSGSNTFGGTTTFNDSVKLTNIFNIQDDSSANTVTGTRAFAHGYNVRATGIFSHAQGKYTDASGNNSHAEGYNTTASGNNSHAEGGSTTASGINSHAEGGGTTASGSKSHAEGGGTTASGENSHAEGVNTTATGNGSHAEGINTTATGYCSHAEGFNTDASGMYSHAEGFNTDASGMYSHAEGGGTTASGINSHAEGIQTTAAGYGSHTGGIQTYADVSYLTVFGQYSKDSARDDKDVFIVGTGTGIGSSRKDGFIVNKDKIIMDVDNVGIGTTNPAAKLDVVGTVQATNFALVGGSSLVKTGDNNTFTGSNTFSQPTTFTNSITLEHRFNLQDTSVDNIVTGTCAFAHGKSVTASGSHSHAEGYKTKATNIYSHAEGDETTASGQYSHAEGYHTIASDIYSHAEGYDTSANGNASHAEGYKTIATGDQSHAEGQLTNAINEGSHAEGLETTAAGFVSHAEGYQTTATGEGSHAGGYQTYADQDYLTVFGQYSKGTGTGDARSTDDVFIVGTGTGTGSRKDGFIVNKNKIIMDVDNVGIGTTSLEPAPFAKLHVNGTILADTYQKTEDYISLKMIDTTGAETVPIATHTTSVYPRHYSHQVDTNSTHITVFKRVLYSGSYSGEHIVTLYDTYNNKIVGFSKNPDDGAGYADPAYLKTFTNSGSGQTDTSWDAYKYFKFTPSSGGKFTITVAQWAGTTYEPINLFAETTWKLVSLVSGDHASSTTYNIFQIGSKFYKGLCEIINITDGNYGPTNFTGQHHNYGVNEKINKPGFIVSSTGKYRNQMKNCDECNKFKITINESLPIVDFTTQKDDKKVFGVISDKDDTNTERELKYGAFVTKYKQEREDRPLTINSLGEGAIWVCDVNGELENGDYITSSLIPGIGMRQDSAQLMNYTVAKITMDCSFNTEMRPRKSLRYETVEKTRTVSKDVSFIEYVWEDAFDTEEYTETETRPVTTTEEYIEYSTDVSFDETSGSYIVIRTPVTKTREVPVMETVVVGQDASGNDITEERQKTEEVTITKTRQVPRMTSVAITDASGEPVLDASGNPLTYEVQAKERVEVEKTEKRDVEETYDVSQAVIDPDTQQFVYDLVYDDSGNQQFVEKYEEKYVEVFADKYIIYNDKEKTDVDYEYDFDFQNASDEHAAIVGNTYTMAFVGCTYHCG